MKTITPYNLPKLKTEQEIKSCVHEWALYDGCLGYESLVCLKCGIDKNDLKEIREQGINNNRIAREEADLKTKPTAEEIIKSLK